MIDYEAHTTDTAKELAKTEKRYLFLSKVLKSSGALRILQIMYVEKGSLMLPYSVIRKYCLFLGERAFKRAMDAFLSEKIVEKAKITEQPGLLVFLGMKQKRKVWYCYRLTEKGKDLCKRLFD